MHIAFANNFLYLRGGSERVMFEEAEMMRRQDVRVSFFARRQPQSLSTPHEEFYPPLIDPEQLSLPGKLAQAPKLIYNADTYRRFERFLQTAQPDCIHAHNIYGGLTTAIFDAAQRHGIPVVMTLHDYKLICPSYLMLHRERVCADCTGGRFIACVKNRCHKNNLVFSLIYCVESYFNKLYGKYGIPRYLICPSRFMHDKMIENGFAAERVVYVPNSIDVSTVTPEFTHGEYALYVGRLSKEKGLLTLLRACEGTGIPLGILGDGPLRGELDAYVAAHGLSDRVTFFGHQSGEELARIYRQAAFIVTPSEWYENAPMSILEAFGYGKPVIGARIGGIPEMVEPGKTGLLFTPGEVEELRTALTTLWSQPAARQEMGRHARELVTTRFSPAVHTETLLQLYRRVISPPVG